MKVVCHLAERKTDLTPLFALFPQIEFTIARTDDDFARDIADAEIMIGWTADYSTRIAELAKSRAENLKFIQFCTSGIDTPLKNGGFPPNVIVANCAGLRAANIAEHGFGLILHHTRQLAFAEEARRQKRWTRSETSQRIRPLRGSTLCILGMGHVGQALARRAKSFDMRVIAVSRAYEPDDVVEECFLREQLNDALAQADFVAICLPSESATQGLMNINRFHAMKRSALLINLARGDILVESDLIEALQTGLIAAASLDVTHDEPPDQNSPLWTLDNVTLTPHVAGAGREDADILIGMIAENLRLFLSGKPLRRVVYGS